MDTTASPPSPAETIRRLIRARLALAFRERPLEDEDPLGASGLGMDSIGIVELLLDCEVALRMPFPPMLFDAGPVTVGRLIAHAERKGGGDPR